MLLGGKLLCQHRALLRKECRNVHFVLAVTCAPALKCEGSLMPLTNREKEHPARRHVCCHAEEWADNEETEGRQRDVSVAERQE